MKKQLKKITKISLGVFILLAAVIMYNTVTFSSQQKQVATVPIITVDSLGAIEHLKGTMVIQTISSDSGSNFAALTQMQKYLDSVYVFDTLKVRKEVINKYSLIYIFTGTDTMLKPNIILAHMDVVPGMNEVTETKDSVFGRGAIDDKGPLIASIEAIKFMIKNGIKPKRTIYFCFGHDEERGGQNGAKKIAEYLVMKGIKANMLLDEGGLITETGVIPGLQKKVALIGIAEKGYLTIRLKVVFDGGHHSSMSHKETAVKILRKAAIKLDELKINEKISEPVNKFLDYIGPEMSFFNRMAIANRWLFKKMIISKYEKTPRGNALMNTLITGTMSRAGEKDNVIPDEATDVFNIRLLPGDSIIKIVDFLKRVINDKRVQIQIDDKSASNPSPVSPTKEAYEVLTKNIKQVFPGTITAPYLSLAGTDMKHYTSISENCYRFIPFPFTSTGLDMYHGPTEGVSKRSFLDAIRFYVQFMTEE
jgi:carboxypeptidase PM20D1